MKWSLGRIGGIAMAGLAVLALGATVATSHRALADASDLIARGEGDVVLSAIATDLAAEEEQPPSAATLARVLGAHEAEGLRYVALVGRDGKPAVEAGAALLPATFQPPGTATIVGRRARVTGLLGPPRGMGGGKVNVEAHVMILRRSSGPPGAPPPEVPPGMPPGFGHKLPHLGLVVVELEPPMLQTLRRDLARIGIVGALASVILLAFAFAWSRSTRKLATLEERAAREQRLVALGSMSSVMAHELRNPLASLKGHAQLLVEDLDAPADAKRRTKAERVVAEAERLEVLTTSLLDFVRDGPIERSTITPRELVERALTDLSSARVRVDVERAPAKIDVDRERLGRAIHNLVDNALKAGEGDVELTVATEEAHVVVSVRDHGPGLPAGEEARIFEPFVTTRTRGTGLGLAVARRIAEQHGGTLDGATHPEGGAIFRLRFSLRSA